MPTMPLTDAYIEQLQPSDKPIKKFDGDGMYLLVNKAGRYFRMDYRFNGVRKTLALGIYPDTTLAMARHQRDEAQRLLKAGTDPSIARREEKERAKAEAVTSAVHAPPRLTMFPDGIIEIWIGRKALRMNEQEAREVHDMLSRILE